MVGAVDGASGDGSPTSASALTSSSLPRSLSFGTDDGLEAGRSPNRSTPSSRMNSRDLLLGSQRWPGFRSRTGFGSAYFQVDDLGVYLLSVAVTVLMATVGVILLMLVVTLAMLLGKCPKQSLPSSYASFSLNGIRLWMCLQAPVVGCVTTKRALDETQLEENMHLVTWFWRINTSEETFINCIDPTITVDEETLKSLNTVSDLALLCTQQEPYQRPDMAHAVNVLKPLVEQWKPVKTLIVASSEEIDL